MGSTESYAKLGAAAGILPALLINRYLLGNTSGKSALIAALLGGGVGALGGVGLKTWRAGKQTAAMQEMLANALSKAKAELEERKVKHAEEVNALIGDPDTDPDDPDTIAKIKDIYLRATGQEMTDEELSQAQAQIDMHKLQKNFKLSTGSDSPVIPLDSAVLDELDRHSDVFRDNSKYGRFQELTYGGLNTGNEAEDFSRVLHSPIGSTLPSSLRNMRLAAMINYHNKLYAIASSKKFNSFPEDLRIPEVADYMALQALQPEQRKLVPLMHRLTSISRAKASKGWSYEIDRNIFLDPEYLKQATRIPSMQRQFADIARAAASGATYKTPGMNFVSNMLTSFSVPAQDAILNKQLPSWNSNYTTNTGDTFKSRYYRNLAVSKLFSPDTGIPIYSWAVPEIQSQRNIELAWSRLADAVDTAADVYGGWKTIKSLPGMSRSGGISAGAGLGVNVGLNAFNEYNNYVAGKNIDNLTNNADLAQAGGVIAHNGDNVMDNLFKAMSESIVRRRRKRQKPPQPVK